MKLHFDGHMYRTFTEPAKVTIDTQCANTARRTSSGRVSTASSTCGKLRSSKAATLTEDTHEACNGSNCEHFYQHIEHDAANGGLTLYVLMQDIWSVQTISCESDLQCVGSYLVYIVKVKISGLSDELSKLERVGSGHVAKVQKQNRPPEEHET